ncbi:MAG: hypothetical protein D6708_16910, partial [Candidatus Dadabacteria bacterium]
MNRSVRGLVGWAVIGVMVAAMATPVRAARREYREDFGPSSKAAVVGGVVETLSEGTAWRAEKPAVRYPHQAGYRNPGFAEYRVADLGVFDPAEGVITVWIRNTTPPEEQGTDSPVYNTIFEVLDAGNQTLLSTYVVWESPRDSVYRGQSFVDVWGPAYGQDLWGGSVLLGRAVKPGEWVRLDFVWQAGRSRILVDGKPATRYLASEDVTDPTGADPRTYFARADRIRLGLTTEEPEFYPNGYNPMYQGEIRGFTVASPAEVQLLGIFSVSPERTLLGAGGELSVTVRGMADLVGSFSVEGIAENVPMTEVDDGVYVGKVAVPDGVNGTFPLTGTLRDASTGETASLTGPSITVDTTAPEPVASIIADSPWAGEIEVSWTASPSADVDRYEIYRGEGADPDLSGAPYDTTRKLSFTDTAVVPGLQYRYAVVAVDRAGNRSTPSEIVAAEAAPGEGPAITGVTVEPFGKPAKPGDTVTVTVVAQSGATVTADLGTIVQGLALTEEGRTGRYTGTYTVTDADVGPTKALHRVVVHVADAY